MQSLFEEFGRQVHFLFVYIKEAHPSDGWQVPANRLDNIVIPDPKTFGQRQDVAKTCCSRLELTMPVVIDGLDNQVCRRYAAWPERLYLVGTNGRIIFQGRPGPGGFKPQELTRAIESYLREHPTSRPVSRSAKSTAKR